MYIINTIIINRICELRQPSFSSARDTSHARLPNWYEEVKSSTETPQKRNCHKQTSIIYILKLVLIAKKQNLNCNFF